MIWFSFVLFTSIQNTQFSVCILSKRWILYSPTMPPLKRSELRWRFYHELKFITASVPHIRVVWQHYDSAQRKKIESRLYTYGGRREYQWSGAIKYLVLIVSISDMRILPAHHLSNRERSRRIQKTPTHIRFEFVQPAERAKPGQLICHKSMVTLQHTRRDQN